MHRFIFLILVVVLVGGCGHKEEATQLAQQQVLQAEKNAAIALANLKAAEEKAASEKAESQRIIFALGVGALLALFVGIGMGSSARKKADQLRREWHG